MKKESNSKIFVNDNVDLFFIQISKMDTIIIFSYA